MGDAIVRTLYRLFVSRRHLLEWTTAAQATSRLRDSIWPASIGGWRAASSSRRWPRWSSGMPAARHWPVAAPFVLAWIASPAIARWVSVAPADAGSLAVSEADARCAAADRAAHLAVLRDLRHDGRPHAAAGQFPGGSRSRSSPTGPRRPISACYLLSTVAARDFGWIGTLEAVERLEATLATMGSPEALPRPLLQLVRHARSAPARSALCLVGRQRQPGRPPDRAGQRLCRHGGAIPPMRRGTVAGAGDAWRSPARRCRLCATTGAPSCVTPRELAGALGELAAELPQLPDRLDELVLHAGKAADIADALASERGDDASADMLFWVEAVQRSIESHRRDVAQDAQSIAALERRLQTIEATARAMALAMEFGFLLDQERKLLSIGYRRCRRQPRPQLLRPARVGGAARELRGDRQGRRAGPPLVPAGPRGDAGRARRGADLVVGIDVRISDAVAGHARAGRQPARADQPLVVRRQIDYGEALGVPWGISESAYNARDMELTYQYSNFGVPGLGLKRGLGENVVIAPYATALATMVDPAAAARNFDAAGRDRRRAAATASTRRSTTRRRACRKARRSRSCAPSWPTIRA